MDSTKSERKKHIKYDRVLVLDDDPRRRSWFQQQLIGYVCDFAVNASEAIEFLKKYEYTDIFLDHDLEPEHYESFDIRDDEKTGYAVACFLEKYPSRSEHAQIIVHSQNPSGSARMVAALKSRKARHVNFLLLKETLKVRSK